MVTVMAEFILSCCSTADLSKDYFEKRNIKYVCFHFELGGVDYLDDLGVSVPPATLYKKMLEGANTKTSMVSIGEYKEFFEPFLAAGKDILHLTLSSGISGSYNSAIIAKEELSAAYPNRKIYIVDSLAASSGFGLLMDKLADLRDDGKTIDEVYNFALSRRLNLNHWFFSSDLTFYIRGGRVTKAAGLVGTVLKICPLLNVDFEGRLIPREKVQSKKRVIKRITEKMVENAINGTDYSDKCFISHSECYEDARAVADIIEQSFPKLKGKVEIFNIGATIGSHTGPGTVALFFWGNKRVD
jgi:DegV family protein with EDD domain